MPVYLVQAGGDGPVKIGWTKAVGRRLGELQAASPVELELRGVLDAPPELEAALHRAFARLRLHGEWFQPVVLDRIEDALASIELPSRKMPAATVWGQPNSEPVPGCPYLGSAVRAHRAGAAFTLAGLARRSGLKERVLRSIERGQYVVTWPVLCRLAEALGVDVADIARMAGRIRAEAKTHASKTDVGHGVDMMLTVECREFVTMQFIAGNEHIVVLDDGTALAIDGRPKRLPIDWAGAALVEGVVAADGFAGTPGEPVEVELGDDAQQATCWWWPSSDGHGTLVARRA